MGEIKRMDQVKTTLTVNLETKPIKGTDRQLYVSNHHCYFAQYERFSYLFCI